MLFKPWGDGSAEFVLDVEEDAAPLAAAWGKIEFKFSTRYSFLG